MMQASKHATIKFNLGFIDLPAPYTCTGASNGPLGVFVKFDVFYRQEIQRFCMKQDSLKSEFF